MATSATPSDRLPLTRCLLLRFALSHNGDFHDREGEGLGKVEGIKGRWKSGRLIGLIGLIGHWFEPPLEGDEARFGWLVEW